MYNLDSSVEFAVSYSHEATICGQPYVHSQATINNLEVKIKQEPKLNSSLQYFALMGHNLLAALCLLIGYSATICRLSRKVYSNFLYLATTGQFFGQAYTHS